MGGDRTARAHRPRQCTTRLERHAKSTSGACTARATSCTRVTRGRKHEDRCSSEPEGRGRKDFRRAVFVARRRCPRKEGAGYRPGFPGQPDPAAHRPQRGRVVRRHHRRRHGSVDERARRRGGRSDPTRWHRPRALGLGRLRRSRDDADRGDDARTDAAQGPQSAPGRRLRPRRDRLPRSARPDLDQCVRGCGLGHHRHRPVVGRIRRRRAHRQHDRHRQRAARTRAWSRNRHRWHRHQRAPDQRQDRRGLRV